MQSKQLNLLINAGSALVATIVVGYVVYSAFHVEAERACSARYPAPTRFSLQSGEGKPLTAIELQARAGSRDMGVIDNAAVVKIDRGPAPEALEVKLRRFPAATMRAMRCAMASNFAGRPPACAARPRLASATAYGCPTSSISAAAANCQASSATRRASARPADERPVVGIATMGRPGHAVCRRQDRERGYPSHARRRRSHTGQSLGAHRAGDRPQRAGTERWPSEVMGRWSHGRR